MAKRIFLLCLVLAALLWWAPCRAQASEVEGIYEKSGAGELYSAVYDGFYPHAVMVAGYYAFLALALALAFRLDWHRNFTCKNRPAEQALAALPRRRAVYYLLIVCILVGLILSNGGFGSTNFSAYAGF